jgi:hypothetical protein
MEACGSTGDTYSNSAYGTIIKSMRDGKYSYSVLDASCACLMAKKKLNLDPFLCKHAFAALTSIIDHECVAFSNAAQLVISNHIIILSKYL